MCHITQETLKKKNADVKKVYVVFRPATGTPHVSQKVSRGPEIRLMAFTYSACPSGIGSKLAETMSR